MQLPVLLMHNSKENHMKGNALSNLKSHNNGVCSRKKPLHTRNTRNTRNTIYAIAACRSNSIMMANHAPIQIHSSL